MTTPEQTPKTDAIPLSTAVVRAVAEQAGEDSTDLPPLYAAIEPDALNRLFDPMPDGIPRTGGEVAFDYAGYRVTVSIGRGIDIAVEEASP